MPRKPTVSSPAPSTPPGSVDLRPAEARVAFDAAVLSYVSRAAAEVSSNDVLAACGGTQAQVRASLNRAIGEGTLSWSGKARWTRYFVPGIGHAADDAAAT